MVKFAGPPPECIDPDASYAATFSTTEGDFTATLDATTAPETVNNFVVLARYRYYDGLLTMLSLLQVSGHYRIYGPVSP